MSTTIRPLVLHFIYRLDFGGLETLLVECINRMPAQHYRHAVVCLTDYTEFAQKIVKQDVELFALKKPPGLGLQIHLAVFKLLKRLKPAVLHTYNLPTIEYTAVAKLAGVPVLIHAEHGRDVSDPDGRNRKHNLLRQLLVPIIDRVIPVSADLQNWLTTTIKVPARKNVLIHNGVDMKRFSADGNQGHVPDWPFESDCFVIGAVGRVQEVKNQQCLLDAFVHMLDSPSMQSTRLRLAIVGDGPLLVKLREKVRNLGIEHLVWLPGARSDIPAIMRNFSLFALTSIAEGTPVVILEAMASALPVVATRVGGIPDVVADGVTGTLVPPSDSAAVASAIAIYLTQPPLVAQHGQAGRTRVQAKHSVEAMVGSYAKLYDELCVSKITNFRKRPKSCAE